MRNFTENSVRKASIPAILIGVFAILLFSAQNMAPSVKAGAEGELERLRVPIDAKPTSCPNPINLNNNGDISIAIVSISKEQTELFSSITGSKESFDAVESVDLASIRLADSKQETDIKIAPTRSSIEDAATPYFPSTLNELDCTTSGPDGTRDLIVKFEAREVTRLFQKAQDGEVRALVLTGKLKNGQEFFGVEVIRVNTQKAREVIIKPPTEEKP